MKSLNLAHKVVDSGGVYVDGEEVRLRLIGDVREKILRLILPSRRWRNEDSSSN